MDRLSSLPHSLIEHILERLPQKDRVRTSILSTKWRLLWSQLPSVLFDSQFHSSVSIAAKRPLSEYLSIITSLLIQRKCETLHLSLFVPENLETYSLGLFDHLVKSFLSNGVQKLFLAKAGQSPYRIPAYVFTSLDKSSTACLTHLQLCNCEFSPPTSFGGFSSLVSFELRRCQATADAISNFVASCPTLQKLVLENLNFPKLSLIIDAPELRHLCVRGKFEWLFIINVESIEVLDIYMEVLPEKSEVIDAVIPTFFNGMTKLEKITLGGRFCELLASHSDSLKLAKTDVLRSLAFVKLQNAELLVYLWNSIKILPNLADVTISLADEASGEPEMKDHDKDCILGSLSRVGFQNISGTSSEMQLIESLLRCTPTLHLMAIKFNSRISHENTLNHVRGIMKFCRGSNKAKVDIAECAAAPPIRRCSNCAAVPSNYCSNCRTYSLR